MKSLVKVTLHGELGSLFNERWDFAVNSVSQALNAIDSFTNNKFFKYLGSKQQKGAYYRVLINGEDFVSEKPLDDIKNIEAIKESNLVAKIKDLKTIDIIPVLEGAKDIFVVILGVILIAVGVIFSFTGIGAAIGVPLILVGIGLLAAGITSLLSKPPAFDDFREIEGGKSSYLFNGPTNIQREGGPIPVGYGRLLVGSQVVSANLSIYDIDASLEASPTPYKGVVKTINADKRPVIDP